MRYKSVLSLFVISVLLVSIFSPMAEASIVYGPEKYTRTTGSPDNFINNFSVDPQGNYTLYVKNGDLISNGSSDISNGSSSSIVWLNGEKVFRPDDFKEHGNLLAKSVSVNAFNQLQVEMGSKPGSHLYIWVEDDAPDIVITAPWDDTISNNSTTVKGYVVDGSITYVTFDHNGATFDVPVAGGSFSTTVELTQVNNITVSAIDSTGTVRSVSLLLDGDYLPADAEMALGFDPLDPDSDSGMTAGNEAGNGVPDGFEILNEAAGEQLPGFVKYRIGADQFKVDTDDDGLTDSFELLKMGLLTDVRSNDTDSDGITDAQEDPDNDSLVNIQEQSLGTDPLRDDTDRDGLKDGYEVSISYTDPLSKDSDKDGLQDDSELRLGTYPNVPDSNNNGILDGNETYTSTAGNETLGTSVSVTGKGDLAVQLTIGRETSEYYTNVSALVSPLVDISMNGSFDSARITMQYDPSLNPSNLSLCYYNESLGLYVPVASQYDAANHTISASTSHLSMWGVFEVKNLMDLYRMVSDYNNEPYYEQQGIPQPGDTLLVPYNSTLIMTYKGGTAGYNNIFGLWSPVKKQVGTGHGTMPETSFNLGNFTRGTELIFYINNGVGNTWLSGPASGNPDDVAHAYIKPIANDTWLLGWEDMYGGGDRDYDDVVLNLTFSRTAMLDSDGDGLPDDVETHGIMDALGRIYYTKPYDQHSDDDGLTDGYEAGTLQSNGYCNNYYNLVSDPTKADSDSDGLNDDEELYIGTKPLNEDTDSDTILDGADPNPLVKDVPDFAASTLETIRIIIIGAVFGDTGDEGGWFHGLVGDETSGSPFYLLGAILGGLVPIVADLRDTLQSIANLDAFGTVLNAIGFIPGPGDAAKITGTIGIFMVKHADDARYITGITQILSKYLLKYMPDFISMPAFSRLTSGASDNLIKLGVKSDILYKLADKNIDIGKLTASTNRLISSGSDPAAIKELIENIADKGLKINLEETFRVIKSSDGQVCWLEKGLTESEAAALGKPPAGWKHIFEDHIKDLNGPNNEFANAFGDSYRDVDSIQNLIYKCVKEGTPEPIAKGKGGGTAFVYYVSENDPITVITGSNGYIVTSHPGLP